MHSPGRRQRIHYLAATAFCLSAARVVLGYSVELYHLPGFHEPFSAISHLVGVILFACLGIALLRRGLQTCRAFAIPTTGRMFVLSLYSIACVLLMSMSAVFHMVVRGDSAHRVMERLDHSAIFILIAGTYTPVQGLLFRGWARWGPLTFFWVATITAITLKAIFFDHMPEWLGISFYLMFGWFGCTSVVMLVKRHDWHYVKPVVIGGLFYTLGAIMDLMAELVVIPGVVHAHEVFHLAVLAGAFCHWLFIWDIAGQAEPMQRDSATLNSVREKSVA